MTDLKIAGAPISWGVCEVPGWGHQLSPNRVLREMGLAGLAATELGPEGFLPTDLMALTGLLDTHGLSCVGTFVPAVLHHAGHDPLNDVAAALESIAAVGASTLVLAAASGTEGYDSRPGLDAGEWAMLLTNLDRIADHATECGVTAVLHPHVGTMVETAADVDKVLSGARIGLCLDTGHLLIGGSEPLQLARHCADRVAHVHLKDVETRLADLVRCGELTYTQAVAQGMYTPLGAGDVDIAGIVTALRGNGFDGWFVLEQDTILEGEPHDEGPLRDVRSSVAYLTDVLASLPA